VRIELEQKWWNILRHFSVSSLLCRKHGLTKWLWHCSAPPSEQGCQIVLVTTHQNW
jgi:hypothetical protein